MELQVNGVTIDAPLTRDLIEQAIFAMTGESDSFVILSRDNMTYIQAAGGARNGFALEYQEGSLEKHYSCTDLDLSTSQVIQAFQRYLARDPRWKNELTWTREDLGADVAPAGIGKAVAYIILTIAAIAAWRLLT